MPWFHVADLEDFAERSVVGVTHGDVSLAIYKLGGEFFATTDICPHQAVHLSEGEVVEGLIECPGHWALFDIRTGKSEGGVVDRPLATFPAKINGTKIFVLLDEP